jgi:Tol biopolymer transport system component
VNSERRFTFDLDSVAEFVIGFVLLAIIIVIFIGNQIGIRVTVQSPEGNQVGPYEALTLTFSEPVDGLLVTEKLSFQPEVEGKFEWVDSKTMRFVPLQPFQLDVQYSMALSPGTLTSNGREVRKLYRWDFRVRPPLIVYLVVDQEKSQLWTVDINKKEPMPLTDDTFRIFNFDVSQNGEFVVFAAFNDQNGIDLWRVQRTDADPVIMLPCGADRCSVPAISPDGRFVAYVREAVAPTADLSFGSPRIWIFEPEKEQDAPLYDDQQIIGSGPTWSPDGRLLSSYDGLKDEIRLLDIVTSQQMIIPSQIGNPVTWSGDGSSFVYTDMTSNDFGAYTRVYEARIFLNEIRTLFGDNDERDYGYRALAWSPVEDKLVLGLRPNTNDPSMALWLMDPYSRDGQVIVDQPNYIYNAPYWDPWGRTLVFQQFNLKGLYKPEIAIWMPGLEQPFVVAEGLMARWLP